MSVKFHKNYKRISLVFSDSLKYAVEDFFFLLNRGYNRSSSLDLVTARYRLSRLERLLLYRAVFSRTVSLDRRRKTLSSKKIINEKILVDGFNVLSTIQSALLGDVLVRGTDNIIRDMSAYVRKIKVSNFLIMSLFISLFFISRFFPKYVIYVFDSQVSRSLLMLRILSCFSKKASFRVSGKLAKNADKYIVIHADEFIVASSDSVIVDRVNRVFDMGGEIAEIISIETIIDLSDLLDGLRV